jgi:hypothetical protein
MSFRDYLRVPAKRSETAANLANSANEDSTISSITSVSNSSAHIDVPPISGISIISKPLRPNAPKPQSDSDKDDSDTTSGPPRTWMAQFDAALRLGRLHVCSNCARFSFAIDRAGFGHCGRFNMEAWPFVPFWCVGFEQATDLRTTIGPEKRK